MKRRSILWLCPVQGVDPEPVEDAAFVCLHSSAELLDRLPPGAGAHFDAVVIDALPIEPLDYDPAEMAQLLLAGLASPPDILLLIVRPDVASDPLPAQAAFCCEIQTIFGHRPKFVIQLGAAYQVRPALPKGPGGKPSDLAQVTRWEEIARYVVTLVTGRASCVESVPHDEARRLVNLMLGSADGRRQARRLSPAARSVLLCLASGSAATARTLARGTNYSEHTVTKSVRELAAEFINPDEARTPNGNWTFVLCDELAKRYRPWLQSLAARAYPSYNLPILGLSAALVFDQDRAIDRESVRSAAYQPSAVQERGPT